MKSNQIKPTQQPLLTSTKRRNFYPSKSRDKSGQCVDNFLPKWKWVFTLVLYTMLLFPLFWRGDAFANNIDVTNASLTGQVAASDYTLVQFDLTWDNSWRTSTGPSNYDGAWVFVKFKIDGGGGCTATKWQHATLSTTGGDHTINNPVSPGAGSFTINPSSDGKGVMIHRNADGSGSIDWRQVRLRWNYGTDGVGDNCDVTIKVFAVEMVYVPQAAFYVGDGTTANATLEGSNGTSYNNSVFQITAETYTPDLVLGGAAAGSLGNNNATGQTGTTDDFNDATSKSLPDAFPKGYAAFWCMKYECSQEQWKEFLNTLTGTQQSTVFGPTTTNYFMSSLAGSSTSQSNNGIRCKITPTAGIDGEYVCDMDGDALANSYAAAYVNETGSDGRYKAVNYISAQMSMAYLDWAALRPMTELEYEKACRGTLTPVANEYAWGTNVIGSTGSYGGSNYGGDNELSGYTTQTTAGSLIYGGKFYDPSWSRTGPLRCGIFADASSTRVKAGASYYGIMEMSGNVQEYVVGIGSVAGRSYTGLHGNVTLNSSGYANVDYWPGDDGNTTYTVANGAVASGNSGYAGMGMKYGSWGNSTTTYFQVSNRYAIGYGWPGTNSESGFRGVRTGW